MEKHRSPAVNGLFYPADVITLKKELQAWQQDPALLSPVPRATQAVILPHAGYVYSGKTAFKTLSTVDFSPIKRCLILAPSHRVNFHGAALSSCDYFDTPLGSIPVDQKANEKLMKSVLFNCFDGAHLQEHALEVELPLLQFLQSRVLPVVPIIIGNINQAMIEQMAQELECYMNQETLWIISSDFTHFGSSFHYVPFEDHIEEKLKELDMNAAKLITAQDYSGFCNFLKNTSATICGQNPIKVLLYALHISKKKFTAEVIDYTTSAQITGDLSHIVSYVGITVNPFQ